jgi:hypothetical protein
MKMLIWFVRVIAVAITASALALVTIDRCAAVTDGDTPPRVTGMSYASAVQQLQEWSSVVVIHGPPLNAKFDPEQLIVQSEFLQNPGWSTAEPAVAPEVELIAMAEVPAVEGLTLGQATNALEQRDLCVLLASVHSQLPTGRGQPSNDAVVTSQQPSEGTVVVVDDCTVTRRLLAASHQVRGVVTLQVTTDLVLVPTLIGMSETQARGLVERSGLIFALDLVRSGKAPGTVIGQDPAPNSIVDRGSAVTARVRRQPSSVDGPFTPPNTTPHPSSSSSSPPSYAGGEPVPRAVVVLVVALLLLLLLVLVAKLARSAHEHRRSRGRQMRVRSRIPAAEVRLDVISRRHDDPVIGIRQRHDPGTIKLEEDAR